MDAGEDVVASDGAAAGDELLAEGAVFEDDAEDGEALVEDLLAVGDEEELSGPSAVRRRR